MQFGSARIKNRDRSAVREHLGQSEKRPRKKKDRSAKKKDRKLQRIQRRAKRDAAELALTTAVVGNIPARLGYPGIAVHIENVALPPTNGRQLTSGGCSGTGTP
jgi:hypothetical protein